MADETGNSRPWGRLDCRLKESMMRGIQTIAVGPADNPGSIRVMLDLWNLSDNLAPTGCWSVHQFNPSVEESAVRAMRWSERLGSIERAQLLVGLEYFLSVRGICFEGPRQGKVAVELVLDGADLTDEDFRAQLAAGLRQGLRAVDVQLVG